MLTHALAAVGRSAPLCVLLAGCASAPHGARAAPTAMLDAEAIGRVAGAEAKRTPGGTVRIAWPRRDVPLTVDGVKVEPPAGLSSWAAFVPAPGGAMMMGDTVVYEDEAEAAMDAAFAHDLEVTALHNHFFFDQPHVYFMHIGGMGDPVRLAAGVKAVWDAVRDVRHARPQLATSFGGSAPSPGTIDAAAIERIVGHAVEVKDGIVKVTIAREGSMHGVAIGGSAGLTTWGALSGGDALAAVDGDVIMTAEEVQPVLRQLRRAGLHVVALHNHMIGEQPAFFFTHFWGKGPAADLARGFRAVLDAQAAVPRK
jgi:uncharacterized protein DUF1259